MTQLNPESLEVTTFETEAAIVRPSTDVTVLTFDPTACTHCFVC